MPNLMNLASAFLVLLACLGTVFVTGCSKPSGDGQPGSVAAPAQHPELSFPDQLALGRSGQSEQIELLHNPVEDATLELLSADDDWLGTLILDAGTITDRGAQSIAQLPQLWHLRLRQSPLTDLGLGRIADCRSIQILNLPQCDASAQGVAKLAELSQLHNLRLGGPNLGAETADAIASIQSLRNIHLIGVPINDEGLRQIASLPKLQSLYLDDSAVSPQGWDWLFETHPDLHVHVNQKHLDRDPQDHQ